MFIRLNNVDEMFSDIMSRFNKPPAIIAITEAQWREVLDHLNYFTNWHVAAKADSIPFYGFVVVPTRWKP